MVWSGDLASSAGPDDVFVYPDEGSNIWTDNMLIPKGAPNKYTAELMMDWVYDVDRAARLANFIYYISPVTGVDEAIKALDPEVGDQSRSSSRPPTSSPSSTRSPTTTRRPRPTVNELFADLTGV